MPSVFVTPFPYWHQLGFPSPEVAEKCGIDISENCLHSLELLLAQQSHPKDTGMCLYAIYGFGLSLLCYCRNQPVLSLNRFSAKVVSLLSVLLQTSSSQRHLYVTGYVPATKRFLEGLREICTREGILLIIDEYVYALFCSRTY